MKIIECKNLTKEYIVGETVVKAVDDIALEFEQGGILEGVAGYMHILSYSWTEEQEKGCTIGWLDDRAEELYYLQIMDGRMPQRTGEIAMEQITLL